MKKILLRIGIVLVLLLVAAVLAAVFFLDGAIKRGVETVGPKLTKVQVKLDGVHVSLFSGSGKINNLFLGNPDGFKSPHALTVGSASLVIKPTSLLSDKIVVRKIELIEPDIIFEAGLGGNNLGKIRANVAGSGGSTTNAPTEPKAPGEPTSAEGGGKKLQVDEFIISGAKVRAAITEMSGQSVVAKIPDIHLKDLGTGPEGITAKELTDRILTKLEEEAAKAAGPLLSDLKTQGAVMLTNAVNKAVSGSVSNAMQDLLKKKK